MASIRDQILAALDRKTEPIDIPEWGLKAFIRTWSEGEKLAIFSGVKKDGDLAALKLDAKTVLASLSDEAGERILTDKDLDVVLSKNATVVRRIAQAAMNFNGMGESAGEDIEKNS